MAHQARAYPSFCSMKRSGVFLLPPGWDASPFQGYPQHQVCQYPFICLGGERHWCQTFIKNMATQLGSFYDSKPPGVLLIPADWLPYYYKLSVPFSWVLSRTLITQISKSILCQLLRALRFQQLYTLTVY